MARLARPAPFAISQKIYLSPEDEAFLDELIDENIRRAERNARRRARYAERKRLAAEAVTGASAHSQR